jgi:hypothetical protein
MATAETTNVAAGEQHPGEARPEDHRESHVYVHQRVEALESGRIPGERRQARLQRRHEERVEHAEHGADQ